MRILIDYRPALRQRTGIGQYVHELAGALQRLLPAADSLVLFSSSLRDRLGAAPVDGAGRIDARVPVRLLNLAWHRLEWPPVEAFAGDVDVAHALHPLLIPARRAAQVVTVADLDFLDHPERTRAEIRRDYPVLAAAHTRRADLVVVISRYTARLVSDRFGVAADRIVVCPPGAPSRWAPLEGPGARRHILFIGTIEPRKNLQTLLAAYERLIARRPGAPPLVLAGKHVEHSDGILRGVRGRPLQPHVRILGYVSDEHRYQLYRDAAALVLPSLDEGFGMTALEAMHVGVPVIASDRGALPEVVGDAGILVDALDVSAWTAALEAVIEDHALRAVRSDAGRERARRFTWAASAEALLGGYRAAAARRAASVAC